MNKLDISLSFGYFHIMNIQTLIKKNIWTPFREKVLIEGIFYGAKEILNSEENKR